MRVLSGETLAAMRAERLVFAHVDLTVAPGEALLLRGPNGAGKSTVIRMLAGLLRPTAGVVAWQGEDIRADLVAHAGRVAMLGHQDAIKPALSVAGNLDLFAPRGGAGRVMAALSALGLERLADLPARLLSAGQKRRLALARLAVREAALWLLDEPTLGLDDASIGRLGTLLAEHLAAGGMLVAATHVALPLPNARVLRLGA